MSNLSHRLLSAFAIALLAGTVSAGAGDETARVAEATHFRPAPPIQNLLILKTQIVPPDTSLAFSLDETPQSSRLSTGELFRQLLIDMPLAQSSMQAATPRPATDGRGR